MRKVKLIVHKIYQGKRKSEDVFATYGYDTLNQLKTATIGSDTYAYTYDNGGNILSKTKNGVTTTYSYGNSDWKDLLTSYGGQSITYDTNMSIMCVVGERGPAKNGWGEVSIAAIWKTGNPNHMTANHASGLGENYEIILYPGVRYKWSD